MTMPVVFLALLVLLVSWIFEPAYQFHITERINALQEGKHYAVAGNSGFSISQLSVVIPAYNEEARLPAMMNSAVEHMQQWSARNNAAVEIVVVDDGSTDRTAELVLQYSDQLADNQLLSVRLVRLFTNRGKGAALKLGVLLTSGRYVLIADADGATEISDFDQLYTTLRQIQQIPAHETDSSSATTTAVSTAACTTTIEAGRTTDTATATSADEKHDKEAVETVVGAVLGSRAHLAQTSIATRAFYRTVLMAGFHLYVKLMVTGSIGDTQCGFKLFTRATAQSLFGNLHLYRWAFDTELIYLAEYLQFPIVEVPVKWREVEGSKLIQSRLDVVTTSLTMARDILCMRLSYLLRIWKYPVFPYFSTSTISTAATVSTGSDDDNTRS